MITSDEADYTLAHTEWVTLVESARHATVRRVNALMSAVYWEIGRRIVEMEQGGSERPIYDESLIERLAVDLGARFGRGFSTTHLRQMRAFHLVWPPERIQQTLSAESSRGTMTRPLVCLPWPRPSPCPGSAMSDC